MLRVLSADEKGIHGRNPSALVLDEVHTFTTRKQREFYVGATTAMGTRANPLTLMISSAGWDKNSICYELHQYAAEVRSGLRSDPSFLSVFYGAPENADWTDRAVWKTANPALSGRDAFLSLEYLENEFRQAEAMPARQNAFRTFFLNQWVGQLNRLLDMHGWDASHGHATTLEDLAGRHGYGGLDLGAISDITAAAILVPCRETADAWDVFLKCYLPEASLDGHRHEDMYRRYARDGWLTLTGGDVVDYRFVETDLINLSKRLNLRGVNIDARFQGIQTATVLSEHGLDVRQMPQTHAVFAAHMAFVNARPPATIRQAQGHALECSSITAEIIPRRRPDEWDLLGRLNKTSGAGAMQGAQNKIRAHDLDRPLRITGQLFFDAS